MKDELLMRLESFEIDQAGVKFPFIARLARENGWSRSFARRVVDEYKRFVWLAMRAGHPVTPSEEVDEAWHLHLCYTRSYWDGMCRTILGKPLHHGPTEGGQAEDEKFADWYGRTLDSYRRHFGEEPPADIWPSPDQRFRPVATRKVDEGRHWIISKRGVQLGLAGAAVLPLLAGCTGLIAAADWSGLICLLIPGLLVFAMVVGARRIGRRGGGRRGCGGSAGSAGFGASGCGTSSSDDGGRSSDDSGSGCGSSGCSSSGCGGGGCGGGGGD